MQEENFADDELERYQRGLENARVRPTDPWSHGDSLLDVEKPEGKDGMIPFSEIVDRQIQLANINKKDPILMRCYQIDAGLLVHLRDMAQRDEGLRPVFRILYNRWRAELILTKAVGGSERKLQAAIVGYRPRSELEGYGIGSIPSEEEEPELNAIQKFLDMLRGRNRDGGEQNE